MMVRTHAGKDYRVLAEFDGAGRLAGFANYAGGDAANALVWDILPTILQRPNQAQVPISTALVVVARYDLPAGQEMRYDYGAGGTRGVRTQMLARGIPAEALDSTAYRERRWKVADEL